MPISREDVLMALKKRGYNGPEVQGQSGQSAMQVSQQPDINSLIQTAMGRKANLGTSVGSALSILGGGQPVKDTSGDLYQDLAKTALTEQVKNQYEDPTVRQLRQAEIDALSTPPGPGFVRVGRQILPDPNYVKPADQRKIDEEEQAKRDYEESLKASASENLNTIKSVKEGARFFGPLGDVPSVLAPSSLYGQYGERKKWESNVDKLLSQKVIDVMSEMKKASKTGASGFGQLTEKELAVLRSASTALNRGLEPEDAMYYLDEMEKIHQRVLGGGGGASNQFNSVEEAEAANLPPGTEVIIQGRRAVIE